MRSPSHPFSFSFPSLLGTQHGSALLPSTPATAGGGERLRGPRPLPALGLRASKVSIYSRPPQPSALSYQLKHFRVQAKKPKSILKKSLKGQTQTPGREFAGGGDEVEEGILPPLTGLRGAPWLSRQDAQESLFAPRGRP